ncbi:MAG: anthranilate phosphoribosyltransferase [Bacillota bacterium]
MSIKNAIAKIVARENLTEDEAYAAVDEIMSGGATDAQIASFMTALRMKGETVDEIAGCARAMRSRALKVKPSADPLVDTCGTGGDMMNTFNISTTAALVVAACGLPVAKHGNRSVSSRSGSADVLEALGVNINLSPEAVAACIDETGIGFLFAPVLHVAMKYAIRARREVGIRTVFNILGPLTNPAGARIQLMGVYDANLTEPLAGVLVRLGVDAAFVVHGAGGLDEISTIGPTKVTEVRKNAINTYYIKPEDFGFARATPAELRGGEPRDNAEIILNILKGMPGPKRDVVVLNAAAALVAAGRAKHFAEGVRLAEEAIDSGEALRKLELLREFTNSVAREEANAGAPA